jgi:hypothetical protein
MTAIAITASLALRSKVMVLLCGRHRAPQKTGDFLENASMQLLIFSQARRVPTTICSSYF